MFVDEPIQFFENILFATFGKNVVLRQFEFVSGGCINTTVKLQTELGNFFVKWNSQPLEEMFATEAQGLAILRTAAEIRTPEVIQQGLYEDKAYLLLEFIDSTLPNARFWTDFGARLANLHQHTQAQFGLSFNNYIGSLRQSNEWMANGIDFFIEKRLKVQAGLAFYNEQISRSELDKFAQLYDKIPHLLPNEAPALLHGDLWSGNFMIGVGGEPVLIDPAVYYGFREAELAFTYLFGGFDERFYAAYQATYPLLRGWDERLEIYNLYPLLVHVNLFGRGYWSGIERVLKKYL